MTRKGKKQKPETLKGSVPTVLEVAARELQAIAERGSVAPLTEEDRRTMKAIGQTLEFVREEWHGKTQSNKWLLEMLFGPRTEKTERVLGQTGAAEAVGEGQGEAAQAQTAGAPQSTAAGASGEKDQDKSKGHGRRGAAALTGAERVPVPHEVLKPSSACPDPNCRGKVYPLKVPKLLVRFTASAPVTAAVYECQRVRCNQCEEVFTAAAPVGVGQEKYDESCGAMIAMLRHGVGLPFPRIEKLQEGFGMGIASSTQWDILADAAEDAEPAYDELIRQGAQAPKFVQDDTWMRILKLSAEERAKALGENADERRSGVFTTGIVSVSESVRIALFFTGPCHAGENFEQLLKQRAADLPIPIQICDGSPHNTDGPFETILAHCNLHCRRLFVKVADNFPAEVSFVLEVFREVYQVEGEAKAGKLSAKDRLLLHQEKSAPLMKGLRNWVRRHLADGRIEENSGLGEAAAYLEDHWGPLTAFLRHENVDLDTNLVERALKRAIIYRKNSMGYRTLKGARVGDIFTSLIHTAELNGVNAFEYLLAVLKNAKAVKECPAQWMPWTFRQSLARAAVPTRAEPEPAAA